METNKELITDAQIEQAALKHVAPLFGKIGAGGDYKLTEQFSRLKAFTAELFALSQRSEVVPSAEAGKQVQAPKLTQAELSDPEFMQAYVDECYRVYVEGLNYWKNLAAQPTPAQGDAVPVERKPYAYEFGKPNGDGTYSVVIERGDIEQIAPNKYEYVAPKRFAKEHPPIPLFLEQPSANATRQSSADAVGVNKLCDSVIDYHLNVILMASGSALRHYSMHKTKEDMRLALRGAIDAAIAAQGGKG